MSSYMMHLCISNKVKEKLNLTNEFLYGSILPDVVKQAGEPRNINHYIERVKIGDKERDLPNIKKAIEEIVVGENKEQELGFIAHLIEDYIWFREYIPSYAEKTQDGNILYIKDNSIHTSDEFKEDIYSDYTNSNYYVQSIIGMDKIKQLKQELLNIANPDEYKRIVEEGIRFTQKSDLMNNIFMTKESIDTYIYQATNEVEKVISKLLGDNNE